jgi:Arc-like DNA binding domain
MAKRKKTDTVQLKLRIREELRKRLEDSARKEDRSLNSEMAHRLANSFEQFRSALLLETLLAPGIGLELLRGVATIVKVAGDDWIVVPTKSRAVAEAITKLIGVLTREIRPTEYSFPNRQQKDSADKLAWAAVLVGRLDQSLERLSGPLEADQELEREIGDLSKSLGSKS